MKSEKIIFPNGPVVSRTFSNASYIVSLEETIDLMRNKICYSN